MNDNTSRLLRRTSACPAVTSTSAQHAAQPTAEIAAQRNAKLHLLRRTCNSSSVPQGVRGPAIRSRGPEKHTKGLCRAVICCTGRVSYQLCCAVLCCAVMCCAVLHCLNGNHRQPCMQQHHSNVCLHHSTPLVHFRCTRPARAGHKSSSGACIVFKQLTCAIVHMLPKDASILLMQAHSIRDLHSITYSMRDMVTARLEATLHQSMW